jgi:putative exosortase-associated protein (TIGR04073 family)
MRRSVLVMAGLMLTVLIFPGTPVQGEVYEAPFYTEVSHPEIVQAGGPMMSAGPGGCAPYCDPCCGDSPATKLGRGVTNTLTGWIEVPKHTLMGVFNCNVTPLEGIGVGLARGFGRAIERTGIGIYEAVTFPIPGYYPLLCPEYISLEQNCMRWRTAPYCGGCCTPPCGAPSCCPAPCDWGGGWNQAFAKGDPRPMPPPPGNAPPRAAAPSGGPGTATYPDNFYKPLE